MKLTTARNNGRTVVLGKGKSCKGVHHAEYRSSKGPLRLTVDRSVLRMGVYYLTLE
jgi:hypothetical protein